MPISPARPSTSITEWQEYLSDFYNSKFTEDAARIILQSALTIHQAWEIPGIQTINTRNLLIQLSRVDGPLAGLKMSTSDPKYTGEPPWHEQESQEHTGQGATTVFGFTRPSKELDSILRAASAILIRPNFHHVTPWHIALATITSQAKGFLWQLDASNSSVQEAAEVLRLNITKIDPDLGALIAPHFLSEISVRPRTNQEFGTPSTISSVSESEATHSTESTPPHFTSHSTETPSLAGREFEHDSTSPTEVGSLEERLDQSNRPSEGSEWEASQNGPRPPATEFSVWRDYFENHFSCRISEEAATILAKAAQAAASRRGNINNLITVNTKDLLKPLTAQYGPLETLHLSNHAGAYTGRPPWDEHQTLDDETSYERRDAFGSTRPSEEFVSVLETASQLAWSTREFNEVTEWHLAFALISSGPTGFKWQLEAQKSSLGSAAKVLRRNMRRREHQLESFFDWSLLDQDPDLDSDGQQDSEAWDRAFDELRNPKEFQWSASFGLILDQLWSRHQAAYKTSEANDGIAARFQPALTPRSIFLASLLYATDSQTTSSDGRGHFLKAVLEATELTESELEELLSKELFRGNRQRGTTANPVATRELLSAIDQSNKIRQSTGSDPYVGSRHLITALIAPQQGLATGELVFLPEDKLDINAVLEAIETIVASNKWPNQYDDREKWEAQFQILRRGLSANNPKDKAVTSSGMLGDHDEPVVFQIAPESRNQLNRFWDRAAIRPGNALSEALAHLCSHKKNLPPLTTPGQLLLGLLQRGEGLARQAPEDARALEILLARRLSRYERKVTDMWDRNGVKYAETSSRPEPSPDLHAVLQLSARLEGECSPGSIYVAPRHFIAALVHLWRESRIADLDEMAPLTLDDLEASLREHLPVFKEQDRQGAWESFLTTGKLPPLPSASPAEQEAAPTGGKHNASRRHDPDELCLDIDRYAEASAQLLKNASDESDFVFGLFGPWGRGKTTLAEEIQFRVEKKGYVCVRFCAWKYPTRPEIWVHLYEEILRRAQMRLESDKERADLESPDEESWLQRLKISFRVGILSQGWSPLVLGSVLLLVSRLHWLDLSLGVGRVIGWSGAILLAAFALRSTYWLKALRFHYGVLPTHRDKLGLQSVVGHDLTNLLKVWISPAGVSVPKPLKRFWLLWISAGAVCFACILAAVGVLNHAAGASQSGTRASAPRPPMIEEASTFGDLVAHKLPGFMGWPFRTIDSAHFEPLSTGLWIACILVIIGLVPSLIAALIRFKPQTFERILLVVDDLDRCEPDQMLAVVESLRVFLDKSEMSRRMQILMLIDDQKLDQAILKRAREQRWIPKTRQERDAYCREQREKYFVTSIRLARLDDDDISDITSRILDREANEDQAKRLRELKAREEANKRSLAKDDNAVSTTHVEKPARTIQHSVGPNLPKTEVTEIESEVRRPATSQEMDRERDLIRAEKDRARIEENERKKIEDELGRRTTNRLPKDINEKTKFTPIERRLLHEWVHEQSDEHTSPRTIRTLITRYLLARLMISTFGFEPDARTLLSALAGRPLDAKLQPDELRAYQRVAATLQQSS